MPILARGLVVVLAMLVVLVSALSAVESNDWWIRVWDFPRLQILVFALALAVAVFALRHPWRLPIAAMLAIASGWQLYRVFPYTRLASTEVALADDRTFPPASCFTALSLNVLQSNRDYVRTRRMLEREDPDLLILLETDRRWAGALAGHLGGYETVVGRPLDNSYGIIVATRLQVRRAAVHTLTERRTPSVWASLVTDAGTPFQFVALHPRPPRPGQDTDERDAEIAIAARRAARTPVPTLAMGDFNDVAWSHTSHLFKRIGGYLDPRVGRGPYATFPADWPLLRWPLDHVFVSPDFAVRSIRILEDVGSDHLPIAAELCLLPAVGRAVNARPAAPDAEDRDDMREIFREYGEDELEDARETATPR